jgi:ABC-type transport system involved in multi-copper enzyme maturation permease subunit
MLPFFRVVYGSALLAFFILVVAVFMGLWLLLSKIFLVIKITFFCFSVFACNVALGYCVVVLSSDQKRFHNRRHSLTIPVQFFSVTRATSATGFPSAHPSIPALVFDTLSIRVRDKSSVSRGNKYSL